MGFIILLLNSYSRDNMSDFMKKWVENRNTLRKHDMDIVFKNVPEKIFKQGLELGAGDGFQSRILMKYCESLICTEYNKERLDLNLQKEVKGLKCEICDAENLPFKENSFDFIFSSSVLEHLKDPDKCLSELNRVLDKDGMMIHIMPTRLFKLAYMTLHFPFVAYMLMSKERREVVFKKAKTDDLRNNIKSKDTSRFSKIFPPIHGENAGHISEFYNFGKNHWIALFERNGFSVRKIKKASLSSGYRFGFNNARKLGERLGLCSFYAYIITKKESRNEKINFFN